ncbi:MAG: glycine cleavage system aminomethyltransferase GcvT [Bacteroidota bacterium]
MKLKNVQLAGTHEKLGAKMVPFAGYNMPVRYSSDKEEHNTVREGVGIFDVSHMGEFLISGPKALDLIQKVTSNDASKLSIGKAQYSCLPNEDGGIIDDLLVYKIKEEQYMLVVNASNIDKDWSWISRYNEFIGAEMRNISDDYSLFAIQGPKATDTLQKLTSVQLSEVKFYTFEVGDFAGADHVIISATGYTGAGGFEIYLHNQHAEKIWDEILKAGEEFGIKPIGLGARDTLRMEMGYCLYGNDIDDITSPLEAGLGWITKFTKDFVNSEALKKQKEEGVSKKLVGFKMEDLGIPRQGYEIQDVNGKSIGRVTSGTMSPTLSIGIGLGYIQKEYTAPDTEIYIAIRDKSLKAKVSKLPLIS